MTFFRSPRSGARTIAVLCGLAAGFLCAASAGAAGEPVRSWRFDFGTSAAAPGWTAITPEMLYSAERGFGFEPGGDVHAVGGGDDGQASDGVSSERSFRFSVALPEGNYAITLQLGVPHRDSATTVKAESRRLMLEDVRTSAGAIVTRTITVNIRTPALPPPERNAPGGSRVVLNDRERGVPDWDDKLTLEFDGPHPGLVALEIVPADDVPVVYLLGDSTVTDQPREPNASWGQMLPRFFKPGLAVANHAESGETLKSFISGLRLAKVLSTLKPGDTLLIQFGHNDSKKQWPQTYAEAHTTFAAYLRVFIAEARLRGATPVLVTPMHRRVFDEHGRIRNTHGDYPAAMRAVAREEHVALIDLLDMSAAFYEALGPERAARAFADGGRDRTHHNNYGAYELAKCVLVGIKASHLDLARFIVDDFQSFDPAHPDPIESVNIAPSPGPPVKHRPSGN